MRSLIKSRRDCVSEIRQIGRLCNTAEANLWFQVPWTAGFCDKISPSGASPATDMFPALRLADEAASKIIILLPNDAIGKSIDASGGIALSAGPYFQGGNDNQRHNASLCSRRLYFVKTFPITSEFQRNPAAGELRDGLILEGGRSSQLNYRPCRRDL
ncbi:MAG: hypothetical protein JNM89_01625 [Hyphomicrobiaceae bacterium]|nr:hypothetical protein [Hyphomicrobiaceae bacterium]